ncbi:nonribosomal peptide synthetase [Colletotrichum truncatum]|uniref:Nonribosomal peptide synthetase n=1 Tax=Colletotrichum truncatum TaxID=5467 RepID=A0ACC3ZIG4_COLTU|nr:nonribosomal peptide synthetase [Colletotrichum truncatum]KAF6785631.1 nonribosomal peptide synthetase [Colletotrichum truncatum]
MASLSCLESTLKSSGEHGELPKPSLHNLCYVISTSGSTGKPKIVAIPQGSISSALSAQITGYRLDENSRVAQFASYVFDSSILEIFGTLVAGGCVCVPSDEERMSNFAGFVRRMGVNLLDVTPSLMRTLSPADVPSVKILSLGGEALTQADVDTWASHVYLINTYGPSEASVNSAISSRLLPGSEASNIGRGVACRLWVVEPENHDLLAPIGAVGELLVNGPILARGYLGDELETSRAFVSDLVWQQDEVLRRLWSNDDAYRLYKTGDLVRYNTDGSLNFLGRRDAQIKVRGYRIERQEIEHHFLSINKVEHVAVFDGKEGLCKGKLVAVVGLRQDGEGASKPHPGNATGDLWELYEPHNLAETAKIEQYVRQRLASPLPSYMIPDLILLTKRVPLLVSYKVDLKTTTRAVYDMDETLFRRASNPGGSKDNSAKAVGTELEESLRKIWSEVLEIDRATFGLNDSFFALGGDSISAMKVTRRCREANLHMMTHDLLAGRTIQGLAARIVGRSMLSHTVVDGEISSGPDRRVCNILSVSEQEVEAVMPATPFQHQVYHASRTHPGKPYCATFLAQLTTKNSDGLVDVERVLQAWQSVVNRHSILRTVFVADSQDDLLHQVILRETKAHVGVRPVESEKSAVERLQADHDTFVQNFNSDTGNTKPGPTYHLILSLTSSGELFLTMSLSHLVTDTVALEHMLVDLDMFYNNGTPSNPGTAFAKYTKWYDTRTVSTNNKAWQEKVLRGAKPCIFTQPSTQSFAANYLPVEEVSIPFSITSSQWQTISDFCRLAQVTTSHFFQFCWALLLKYHTQQDMVCFGQLIAGRDAPVADVEDVVGPVLSVLPAYVDLSPAAVPVLELVQSFQTSNIEALAYQPCSLKAIEKLAGCTTTQGLFNTMVNIRKVHYQGKELEHHLGQRNLIFKPLEKRDSSEYDLVLQVDESGGNVSGALAFWSHRFDSDTVKKYLGTYMAILDLVSHTPNSTAVMILSQVGQSSE